MRILKRMLVIILFLITLVALTGCNIKIGNVTVYDSVKGWTWIEQGIRNPNDFVNKSIYTGVQIENNEDISSINIKDSNDNTITTTLDTSTAVALNSFDPPKSGYKWMGYKTVPLSVLANDTFTVSYKITNNWSHHNVVERIKREDQSWDANAFYIFSIGPELVTGSKGYIKFIVGISFILFGLIILLFRKRKRQITYIK